MDDKVEFQDRESFKTSYMNCMRKAPLENTGEHTYDYLSGVFAGKTLSYSIIRPHAQFCTYNYLKYINNPVVSVCKNIFENRIEQCVKECIVKK
jgi:hypothetical protein